MTNRRFAHKKLKAYYSRRLAELKADGGKVSVALTFRVAVLHSLCLLLCNEGGLNVSLCKNALFLAQGLLAVRGQKTTSPDPPSHLTDVVEQT